MSWHLWQIKTMVGDFTVNEEQKNQVLEMVKRGDELIELPSGESFKAHQFSGVLATEWEDPDWRKRALPDRTNSEPELTQEQRDANVKKLRQIRADHELKMAKGKKATELTPLQKELQGVPPSERVAIIEKHMKANKKNKGAKAE